MFAGSLSLSSSLSLSWMISSGFPIVVVVVVVVVEELVIVIRLETSPEWIPSTVLYKLRSGKLK